MTNKLVEGDPLEPSEFDVIYQTQSLPLASSPKGEGWRIMTGNHRFNSWARVAYRHEIDGDKTATPGTGK